MTCLTRRATCQHAELGPVIGRLFGEIMRTNPEAVLQGPPMVRYLRWDPSDCEVEAACWVEAGTVPGPGCGYSEFPACSAAMSEHVGPYEGLAAAWAEFWEEFNKRGILASMPCWDCYVTDPEEEANPANWITQLYIPIRRIE